MISFAGKSRWMLVLAAGSFMALAGIAVAGDGSGPGQGNTLGNTGSILQSPPSGSSRMTGGLFLTNRAVANGQPRRGIHVPDSAEVAVRLSRQADAFVRAVDARGSSHVRSAECRLAGDQGDAGNCEPAVHGRNSRLY